MSSSSTVLLLCFSPLSCAMAVTASNSLPSQVSQTNTRLARSISGRMKVSLRHVPVAFARLGLKSSETATHFPSKHPAQPCWNANLLLMEGLSTRQASAERGRIRHAGPPRLGDSPSRGLCTRCIFANFLAASLLVTYSWKVFGNAQRLLDAESDAHSANSPPRLALHVSQIARRQSADRLLLSGSVKPGYR